MVMLYDMISYQQTLEAELCRFCEILRREKSCHIILYHIWYDELINTLEAVSSAIFLKL